MSTRTLLNLALLAAVGVLLVLAIYEPGIEAPPPVPVLSSIDPAGITRLRVERRDQPTVRLVKAASGWRMVEPYALAANDYRARALLEVSRAPSHWQRPAGGLDLDRFSLDNPKASLYLDDIRIDFGGTESLTGRRYVRLGDTVHLITDRVFHHLLASAANFVDDRLLAPGSEPVAITLPDRRLVRRNGAWALEPEDASVGADVLTQTVNAWRQAQAIEVRPLENAESGQDVSVELAGADTPIRFRVRETESEVILGRPDVGVQYHFTPSGAASLLELAAPHRDEEPAPSAAPLEAPTDPPP
jgi:hypothetical protein